ncbi:cytidine deaminase [Vallitalea guaymasensis]|uniref:Cytidine deaminase n=1 Tax=Vallitalea guaymasensis TaxID=1185412 RepID=A0A8J8MEP8_9FIRM|nr:cytidine deaminase [Vallitalea guaymasensis]QUH31724.1 cytidine deaminase [Vallitalea guaymasensis]
MNYSELVNEAMKAKEMAYVPYSKFKVGAAVVTKGGKIYTGCNIENASFGATNCAERTALFKAVSEGDREFDAIAVVSSSGDFTPPCGICRQVLAELMPEGKIILANNDGETREYMVEDLLPVRFEL